MTERAASAAQAVANDDGQSPAMDKRRGQPARAVRLFGAAEALREALGRTRVDDDGLR